MFGIELPAGTVQALLIVGAVLVQALILYVGYGWLESAVGGKLLAAIRRGS